MTLDEREDRFTKRQEAQQRRDAKVREAAWQYERDRAEEDKEFAAAYDRIREESRLAWEAAKARPAPTYEAARAKHQAAVAAADEQYADEIRTIELEYSRSDK